MRSLKLTLLFAVLTLALGSISYADSWRLPEPVDYYSVNKQFYLRVEPRQLESQLRYFEDKVENREPAGSKPGVRENFCKGTFYRRNDRGEYDKVWSNRLVNDVSPVAALVSDGGQYAVTFDNWHEVGHGDDVVVIYGATGQVIRKMALSDIAPSATNFSRSVSSIWWGGKHYIDENTSQLVLKVVAKAGTTDGAEPEYRDVRVDLGTGQLIKPSTVARSR